MTEADRESEEPPALDDIPLNADDLAGEEVDPDYDTEDE